MSEQLFHIGIKAMVEDTDGRLLLFKQDVSHNHSMPTAAYWDFAGGRVNVGETSVLETLRREIQEETGIDDYDSAELFTTVISNHRIKLPNDQLIGLALVIYKVKLKPNAQIILSDEHTNYEWVDRNEAKVRLAHKYPAEFTNSL